MKKYITFQKFYDFSISLIKNNQKYFKNLSKPEQIKFLRENLSKDVLNSYYEIDEISKEIANLVESKTTCLKFSTDNMVKNLIEHPEITIKEYENINFYIKNAEYILKKNKQNLIYFKIDNKIYQFVIKCTKNNNELYLTTFHKASIKQLAKDIHRYASIKKR